MQMTPASVDAMDDFFNEMLTQNPALQLWDDLQVRPSRSPARRNGCWPPCGRRWTGLT